MISIEQIKKPILAEFDEFERKFVDAFSSNDALIQSVNNYILQKRGKQIRPILTLLAAKSVGKVNENTMHCAVALEMLHTASLIHDDVVDESDERRGQPSVNSKWGNKISILVGDFLLSQSLAMTNKTRNPLILEKITSLGKQLSEGELLQITNVKNINLKEEKYIEVIKKKTATLFDTCTYVGALSAGATDAEAETMRHFGEIYGICFQLKDDIFDYIASEKEIGKPVGNDIKEGKITLPLLYALNANLQEREEYLEIIRNKKFDKENVEKLIQFAINNGGIEYAENKIQEYKTKAEEILKDVKNKEIRDALEMTIQHTTERKK